MPQFETEQSWISTPGKNQPPQTIAKSTGNQFSAYYQTQGRRHYQEDSLVFEQLEPSIIEKFSPEEIANCLESTHLVLNELIPREPATFVLNGQEHHFCSGTSASTMVFDGTNLVIATTGDSLVFAAIINHDNQLIRVKRLNTQVHYFSNANEQNRLNEADLDGRYHGQTLIKVGDTGSGVPVTRALGDHEVPKNIMLATPNIDTYTRESILDNLAPDTHTIKIISTTHTFTKRSVDISAIKHEVIVKEYLENILNHSLSHNEQTLAESLITTASMSNPGDNMSVIVTTLNKTPFATGLFDGHLGQQASTIAAQQVVPCLKEALRKKQLNKLTWSNNSRHTS